MSSPTIRLLLGGAHHDFDGFAAALSRIVSPDWRVEPTANLDAVFDLQAVDVVAVYTCLGNREVDGRLRADPNPEQVRSLVQWVQSGGRLLPIHAATVIDEENTSLGRLYGGRFLSHPPRFDFTVYPLAQDHPITRGVGAFSVNDELYVQTWQPDVRIHMVALDRGVVHPMVWTRTQGEGRVVYVAPGHGPATWEDPAYELLIRRSLAWLAQ